MEMLLVIIYLDLNQYKINWKKYPFSTRRKLFQIFVYFRHFKMALCDKLNLDRLELKEKNICDRIDIEILLKSIQNEACISQGYFAFTEVDNFLFWPLGRIIVTNIISKRSPTIDFFLVLLKISLHESVKK